jgi:hypothetical protein
MSVDARAIVCMYARVGGRLHRDRVNHAVARYLADDSPLLTNTQSHTHTHVRTRARQALKRGEPLTEESIRWLLELHGEMYLIEQHYRYAVDRIARTRA